MIEHLNALLGSIERRYRVCVVRNVTSSSPVLNFLSTEIALYFTVRSIIPSINPQNRSLAKGDGQKKEKD